MRDKISLAGLLPLHNGDAARFLSGITDAASRMQKATRAVWASRFDLVYGDLTGQRRVSVEQLRAQLHTKQERAEVRDILFALQTYFVLLADLVAVAAASGHATRYLRGLESLSGATLAQRLQRISGGYELEELGVSGARDAFDFDWYVAAARPDCLESVRPICLALARLWDDGAIRTGHSRDILAELYHHLLPNNLRHILGEIHTPLWLAELLLADLGWRPDATLVDPFAGTGVFLLAALQRARQRRAPLLAVLQRLCAVDLNPVACAAARANLVLAVADELRHATASVVLPVLCADSIAPALQGPAAAQTSRRRAIYPRLWVDGESLSLPSSTQGLRLQIAQALDAYGLSVRSFIPAGDGAVASSVSKSYARGSRRFWEQLAVAQLAPAEFMATNPPWIGWEYMSRAYRSYLQPAWRSYALYCARGREAAFLKEDLSTLALVVAWDRYLRDGGLCACVLRAATMTSRNAAHGLRRLSIQPESKPVRLELIRQFRGLRVFRAQVQAATWLLRKGAHTRFPVRVRRWQPRCKGWQPDRYDRLARVTQSVEQHESSAERLDPNDVRSRWVVGLRACLDALPCLCGSNPYQARTGVFTGGANAVFYLEQLSDCGGGVRTYRNVTGRAKRTAPAREVRLESTLVLPLVRGRDLQRWRANAGALLLCPHTPETRLHAILAGEMARKYPLALEYLSSMRTVLDSRRGFSGWERDIQAEAFYAIQRVGTYSFAPYKVGWRYVASDFLVAVIGPTPDGRPQLGNDKVMFAALDHEPAAHFVCGVLSSDPVRWSVVSSMTGTQIPTSIVNHVSVPTFDPSDSVHVAIALACQSGHAAVADGRLDDAMASLDQVNRGVAALFGLAETAMLAFRRDLVSRFGPFWFCAGV
jgi:hypothetical protein